MTQKQIEELIEPILNRQESINSYVINKIAKRIKQIGKLLPSDVRQLETLFSRGADVREINAEIARLTLLQENDIRRLIRAVAVDTYTMAKPYYDYRHKPFIPIVKNKPLMNVINAISKVTCATYRNLSNSGAFMIRDLANPNKSIPTSISRAYNSVIDEAVQAVQAGTIDYSTAMRRTVKQLVDSGIKVPITDSSKIQQNKIMYQPVPGKFIYRRLDSVVRTNILDAVRDINQKVQDITGEQYGADGKEITVHQYPAPDHAPIQGKQFTNEEYAKLNNNESFTDVKGRSYDAIERHIGQWNCHHFAYSIVIGVSKPNYTDVQLKSIVDTNDKGYTTPEGKHYTMYDCTQIQRQYELNIRKNKDGQIAAQTAGDIELAKEYQANINKLTKDYKAFSKACGLEMLAGRTTVSGYRRISVK